MVPGLVALVLLAAAADESVAQSAGQQARADSVEQRLRQRLQALGRGPGVSPDSVRLDSLRADSVGRVAEGRQVRGVPEARGDSVILALMEALVGYDVTSYQAQRAEYDAIREVLVLRGDTAEKRARLMQPTGDEVSADSLIRFDQRAESAEALGAPIYAPSTGDPIESRRLVFDTRTRAGAAYAARTRYSEMGGTTWSVTGDLPLVAGGVAYGDHARFTSCTNEIPHYHFETPRLKIVQGRILVARPVKLYFADVPVAWLPFVFQNISGGRSSGILAPRFSVNDIVRTSTGYQRRVSNVGFYWAINDYMDATVALDWFSDNYTAITGNLRYSWLRQFLNGSLSTRRYWRASGGTELSLATSQSWRMSERTDFRVSGQYATSTSFIRRNTFDPREVTSQIRSQGGVSHRFDWASLNLSADRSQSLSDDRVDMNLPRVSLSFQPVTLFEAPLTGAAWYNNIAWNGSANFSRRISTRADTEEGFDFASADMVDMDGGLSSSFTVGRFSMGQSFDYRQGTVLDVPPWALEEDPDLPVIVDPIVEPPTDSPGTVLARAPLTLSDGGIRDITRSELGWNTSINYQLPLPGTTTTLTPNVSLSGSLLRSDTVDVARDFVASPTRVSAGASVKVDLYGFYPGFAGYEALRHKLSPTIGYSWSPEVSPSALQERVFGTQTLQRRSAVSLTLNQTWEGKKATPDPVQGADTTGAGVAVEGGGAPPPQEPGAPMRLEQGEIENILSIRTSAVNYDLVRYDESGDFLSGFQTTTLTNTITSDFLPAGVNVTMAHDLFDAETPGEGGGGGRSFSPHLSRLNFGFGLDGEKVADLLGLFGLGWGGGAAVPAPPATAQPTGTPATGGAFGTGATDEAAILPGDAERQPQGAAGGGQQGGGWSADLNYALTRPRRGGSAVSQILRIDARLQPTEAWRMSWNTSYDLEQSQFNDHSIRLTRNLHRWEAHFSFLQTATGNWSFRFEVSLLDNRDLHFDYEQRSGVQERFFPDVR